jgi:hypothetical protein
MGEHQRAGGHQAEPEKGCANRYISSEIACATDALFIGQ